MRNIVCVCRVVSSSGPDFLSDWIDETLSMLSTAFLSQRVFVRKYLSCDPHARPLHSGLGRLHGGLLELLDDSVSVIDGAREVIAFIPAWNMAR